MVWGSWLTRCRGEAAPAERCAALRRPALLWIQGQDEECGWLGGGGVACWGSQGWSNVGCAAHSSPAAPLLLLFEGTDIRAMGARRPFAAPRVAGGLASADTNPRAFTGERASSRTWRCHGKKELRCCRCSWRCKAREPPKKTKGAPRPVCFISFRLRARACVPIPNTRVTNKHLSLSLSLSLS